MNLTAFDELKNNFVKLIDEDSLKELPEKEKRVMHLHYGLQGETQHSLRWIAGHLGLNYTTVKRLHSHALERLHMDFGNAVDCE